MILKNLRKHGDVRLVTERRKNYLVSKPNDHTTKFISNRN